jgi:hypothetical protein
MTPDEVGGLQSLAQNMGGSLTINPETGLPEANFLRAILPTVLGLGITAATGGAAAPWMVGAGVGGGTALLTGDLQQGLMAGLGAFGGAGLGSTLMGMGAGMGAGPMGALGDEAVKSGLMGSSSNIAAATKPSFGAGFGQMGAGVGQAFQNPGAFGSQLMANLGGPLGAGAAGLGTLGNFGAFNEPQMQVQQGQEPSNYEGPYMPTPRQAQFPTQPRTSTSEFQYFDDTNPRPGFQPFAQGGLAALAAGGELLQDGSFVIDARTVSELGNGSSNAGMELLMQLGGRPVQGPGDGVSDSIPATIEGDQPAAVARDEVIFDPEAVARIGDGDPQKGAQRLYELMSLAEDARKDADRGEDSGVAEGLGAIAPEMAGMGGMGEMAGMGGMEGMDPMMQMAPMGV